MKASCFPPLPQGKVEQVLTGDCICHPQVDARVFVVAVAHVDGKDRQGILGALPSVLYP